MQLMPCFVIGDLVRVVASSNDHYLKEGEVIAFLDLHNRFLIVQFAPGFKDVYSFGKEELEYADVIGDLVE